MLSTTIFEEVSFKSLSSRFRKSIMRSGEHPPYEMLCCVLAFLSSNLDLGPTDIGREIIVPLGTSGQPEVGYYLKHQQHYQYNKKETT